MNQKSPWDKKKVGSDVTHTVQDVFWPIGTLCWSDQEMGTAIPRKKLEGEFYEYHGRDVNTFISSCKKIFSY